MTSEANVIEHAIYEIQGCRLLIDGLGGAAAGDVDYGEQTMLAAAQTIANSLDAVCAELGELV